MKGKTINPYIDQEKEISKFRGISDPSEGANIQDEYVSSLSNLDSFKIREMGNRDGQKREYDLTTGSIIAGGSFVSARAVASGNCIYSELKLKTFTDKAKRYPYGGVHINTGITTIFDGFNMVTRCSDISGAAQAPWVLDGSKSDMVINSKNYMDCFKITCSGFFGFAGDVDGYEKRTDTDDVVIAGSDAFQTCYKPLDGTDTEIDGGNDGVVIPDTPTPFPPQPPLPPTPFPPPNIIDPFPVIPDPDIPVTPEPNLPIIKIPGIDIPGFPFVPYNPNPPGYDIDDPVVLDPDPDERSTCKTEIISFNSGLSGPVLVILEEGYTDTVAADITMSAGYTGNIRPDLACSINATLKSGGEEYIIKWSDSVLFDPSGKVSIKLTKRTAGEFSCLSSCTIRAEITVHAGIIPGTILNGSISSSVLGTGDVVKFRVIVCKDKTAIAVSGKVQGATGTANLTIAGSLPDIQDDLNGFLAIPVTAQSYELNGKSTASNISIYGCDTGAFNIEWINSRSNVNSFYQDYTIPNLFDGAMMKCLFVWVEYKTKQADDFKTAQGFTPGLSGGGYCCGWYTGAIQTRNQLIGTTGSSQSKYSIQTYEVDAKSGDVVRLEFQNPFESPLTYRVDPTTLVQIQNDITISQLYLLIMEVEGA